MRSWWGSRCSWRGSLRGDFRLRRAIITWRNLGFQVAGAKLALAGTYGRRSQGLDFHGKVQLQAKPSQMVTGFKSVLRRPFDHFLRKNGVTELPIKLTENGIIPPTA